MQRSEKHSKGLQFLKMDSYSSLSYISFRLEPKSSKKIVFQLYQHLDKNLPQGIDIFFIYQDITSALFYAVFSYINKKFDIAPYMNEIRCINVKDVETVFIKQLFCQMASTNFRQFDIFKRLKVKSPNLLKQSRNPFLRAVLQANVLKINNYESELKFIDDEIGLQRYIYEKKYISEGIQLYNEQRSIQQFRYGKSSLRYQIHDVEPQFIKIKQIKIHQNCPIEEITTMKDEIYEQISFKPNQKVGLEGDERELTAILGKLMIEGEEDVCTDTDYYYKFASKKIKRFTRWKHLQNL